MGLFNFLAKKEIKPTLGHSIKESGNVFMMLFGAVGMVGVIGASTMTVMKGPVKTMSQVTKRTVAENNMIAAGKLALIAAGQQTAGGDCDGDGTVEPIPFANPLAGFTGGGTLPATIGVAKEDPWGNEYGYCTWDHGTEADENCGGSTNFQTGGNVADQYVLAIVSAGPDRMFNTSCDDYVDSSTPILNKTSGADDIVLGYTYAEAGAIAGGVWSEDGADGATIARDLVVEDRTGTLGQDALSFSAATGDFQVAGAGEFPSIRTDNIQSIGANINVLSPVVAISDITTSGDFFSRDLDATGTLDVTGATTLGGLTAGATTLGATSVDSLSAGSGAISTTGTLNAGDATLGATGVSSLSSGSTITAGGNIILGSNYLTGDGTGDDGIQIDSDGNVTTSNDLTVNGTFAPNSLAVTNNATVGGTLGVTGATTLAGLTAGATTLTGNLELGGNKVTGLGTPTDGGDAVTKDYVDTAVAAGTGFTETDPQVGDVSTAGKWCASDGDSIECTLDAPTVSETDPQVGTLTAGRWCTTDGVDIDCTTTAPTGDDLGNHTATTNIAMASNRVTGLADPVGLQDAVTKAYLSDALENGVCEAGDLSTWTARTAAENNTWRSITYGNGQFVAVSQDGTNRVMTSPDGINWTAQSAAEANGWSSVTYGNGLFVAIAGVGTNQIMTSTDGVNWTARTAPAANFWTAVTYGNGLFVAVATSGERRVMTSSDGINWNTYFSAEDNTWFSITYGNGQFVAVSVDGTNRVMTSSDGINWTARAATEANTWFSITYGNGQFVAVSTDGTNRVMTSPDGINWTAQSAAEANAWLSVTHGNGQFVAVSTDGTNRVMTSPDGINWTAQSAAEANGWGSVTYGNGKFVAVAQTGTNRVMTADGGVCTEVAGDDLGNHTATTALDLATNKIVNLADPTDPQDGATKAYVDTNESDVLAGLSCTDGQVAKWNNGGSVWECADDTAGSGADDLGNHTATTALDLATNKIVNLADPTLAQDGATKAYVDAAVVAGADDLGNHIATTNIAMGNNSVTGMADPTNAQDAATKAYVDTAVVAGADDLGNHTATTNLIMGNNKVTGLGTPTDPADATTKAYVDAEVAGVVATPAGADTQVQFNDGGALGADSAFTFNRSLDRTTIINDLTGTTSNTTPLIVYKTGTASSGNTYGMQVSNNTSGGSRAYGLTASLTSNVDANTSVTIRSENFADSSVAKAGEFVSREAITNIGISASAGRNTSALPQPTNNIAGDFTTSYGDSGTTSTAVLAVSSGTGIINYGINARSVGTTTGRNFGGFFTASNGAINWPIYVDGNAGLAAGSYLNFGASSSTPGATGYGFRDNAGTLEYKNSGGSWTAFAGGGDTLAGLSCTDGQVAVWNNGGSAWICGNNGSGVGDDLGNHTATTALDLATNKIVNLADPTDPQDGATKAYVDAEIGGLTDNDTLAGLSCTDGQVAKWNNGGSVWECADDTAGSGADDLGNHTATTDVDLATNKVINLGAPTAANDATTKTYVDSAVAAAADNLGNHSATQGVVFFAVAGAAAPTK